MSPQPCQGGKLKPGDASSGLDDYDYVLPEDLIAQHPAERRDGARLLVLDRRNGTRRHSQFRALGDELQSGDLLVVNDTRVLAARFHGQRRSGGRVEILLIEALEDQRTWQVLVRPGKAFRPGETLALLAADREDEETVEVHALRRDGGRFFVKFRRGSNHLDADAVEELGERIGETPLPPYIRRPPQSPCAREDRQRYQTLWAAHAGAVAAPTAGLHFSRELLADLEARGIEVATVTLHVGIDTFRPLEPAQISTGKLHGERAHITRENGERILQAREEGRRIVAVGTTTARCLESFARTDRSLPWTDRTHLFIRPPYDFRLVDALITNFHLPRSSLLMMVSAFASRESILAAYEEAIAKRYRFYSYGDGMLIQGG